MTLQQDVDYKNNLFEHPELTRIVGEPSTATLITLQAEVRDNAQSVQSDLGGGANGHLGLVCSDTTYQALVPDSTPYIRPENPGRLQMENDMTQYQIAQVRDEHAEATRVFREVLGVERALIQQIVVAIEPKYLRALRTPGTNKLNKTVAEILQHLFSTYGDVTPTDLRELTARVENLSFPPDEPVDTIFSEIDDLAAIAEIANSPLTPSQKVNIAYIHFQKCHIYKSALAKWDEKEWADQTWANFKTHFRTAHKTLRRTGALTLNDTMNKDQVMNLVSDQVLQVLQDLAPPDAPSPSPPPADDPPLLIPASTVTTDESDPSVNSAVSDVTMQSMQKQLDLMQTMLMQCMQSTSSSQNHNNSSRRNRTNPSSSNPNQCKYCWTHGWCNHFGKDCRSKADGHKDEATKNNRMGGSIRNLSST